MRAATGGLVDYTKPRLSLVLPSTFILKPGGGAGQPCGFVAHYSFNWGIEDELAGVATFHAQLAGRVEQNKRSSLFLRTLRH